MFRKSTQYLLGTLAVVLLFCFAPNASKADDLNSIIFDGAHDGNPDFFFLPPLVGDPNDHSSFEVGTFDPTLSPIVQVCLVENNACSNTQPEGFPLVFQPGTESDSVRISEIDELYITNWHIDKSESESGTYRIFVFAGDVLLGFTDMLLMGSMQEAKSLDSGETYVIVNGALPIKFRAEQQASQWRIVGPEGGILHFSSDILFNVPEGAVKEHVAIRLGELPFDAIQQLLDERVYRSSKKILMGGFVAEPDGLIFIEPVKAILPIPSPVGVLMQAEVDLDAQEYWLSPTDLIFNPETNKAEITLTHFSGHMVVDLADLAARNEPFEIPEWCGQLGQHTVSYSGDFSRHDGCQVVGSEIKTTYDGCQLTVIDHVSETSPECGEDFQLVPTIHPTTLQECRSDTLEATVTDHNGNEWEVPLTWVSGTDAVLRVHLISGDATGVLEGTAWVTARTPDPRWTGEAYIDVTPAPPILIKPLGPMEVNETKMLEATDELGGAYFCDVRSPDGIDLEKIPLTWSVIDASVVDVDPQTGLVTGMSPGIATVTANSADQYQTTTVEVTEDDPPPPGDCDLSMMFAYTEIAGWPEGFTGRLHEKSSAVTLEPSWTRQFEIKAWDYSGDEWVNPIPECLSDEWVWISLDESVATVNSTGLVTARSTGRAYIRVEHIQHPEIYALASVNVVETWLDRNSDGIIEKDFYYGGIACVVGPPQTEPVLCEMDGSDNYVTCPSQIVPPGWGYWCHLVVNPYTDPNRDCDPQYRGWPGEIQCIGTLIEMREEWLPSGAHGTPFFDMPITYRDELAMQYWW